MNTKIKDAQLVKDYLAGDKSAFDKLYKSNYRQIKHVLSSYIADRGDLEDILQETFIKVYQALPTFRGDSSFFTWVYRIGVNTAKEYLRQKYRHNAIFSEDIQDDNEESINDPVDYNTPEQCLEDKQLYQQVVSSIEKLETDLHTVIQLRGIQEVEYCDIAAILKIPTGTVRSRLHRARETVKKEMEN